MNQQTPIYDVVILGGGPAGLTAGIYAGRAKLRTLILEQGQAGGQAATTDEVANYPGHRSITGPELSRLMLEQAQSFGTELLQTQVTGLDLTKEWKEIETPSGLLRSRSVIVATGANPKTLGFEGEDAFRGRGVGYCATCDGFFFEGKDIFVIGGGYSAAEEALYLTRFAKKVTLVVRKDRLSCAQSIVDKVLSHPKIQVWFHTELQKVSGDQVLKRAQFLNNQTGEAFSYEASPEDGTFGIFVYIGYQPNTELVRGQLTLDSAGYIITNDRMETNLPGVYAAGDLRPKELRQLVTATSDGAIAAMQAENYVAELWEKEGAGPVSPAAASGATAPDTVLSQTQQASLLSPELKAQVSEILQKLDKQITLVTVVDDSHPKSRELEAFLREICALDDHLALRVYRQGEHPEVEQAIDFQGLPEVAFLDSAGTYTGVKCRGIPGGHEFNAFILAIYNLAGPGQPVEEAIVARAQHIKTKTKLQVAISLSCHFCPDVVTAAQRLAMLSPNISAEMIDIGLFPAFQQRYNLMSVPAVIVNERAIAFGPQSMDALLMLIEQAQ